MTVELAPAKNNAEWMLQCLGVGLLYFVGGFLVDQLHFQEGASILVWPSAGVALASVVIFGRRVWPGIGIGQVLLVWYHAAPPVMLLGLVPGAALEAVIGAGLLLGKRGMHPEIRSVPSALWFVLQVVVACSLISSTFSVSAKYLAGNIASFHAFFTDWWRWSVGDAVGIIVCFPFLMNWVPHARARRDNRPATFESNLALGGLLLLSVVVYDPFGLFAPGVKALALLPLVLLMWIALRFGMRAATLNLLVVSSIIFWGAAADDTQVLNLAASDRIVVVTGLVFMMGFSALMAAASTEEQVADREATEAGERFSRRILDTTPNLIYVFDLIDQRSVYSNHKVAELLGYSKSQIDEMGDRFLSTLLHPDDLAGLPELFTRWKTATDADLLSSEYRVKDSAGAWHWFQSTDAVFKRDEKGVVTQIIGNARDITESRRAREQARAESAFSRSIVANAGEGICVCRDIAEFPFVRFSVWNGQMTALTGYTMEEINRLGWYQSVYPDPGVQKRAMERMDRMRTGDNLEGEEWEIVRKDGGRRQILITTSIVLSDDGVPNVLGVMNDITSRKAATAAIKLLEDLHAARMTSDENAAKLELANHQLQAINQELEAFSYSISHDLRAPLRHIHGFVRLLENESKDKLSDLGRHRMDVIAESATRMGQLIDDLLAFSRSGRSELKHSRIDLNSLVGGVVAEFKHETEGREIDWKIGALPAVRGDRNLLRQVFVNLVSNAVKYTSRVPVSVIEIGCEPSEQSGMEGLFIRDNGAGFDMKYSDKLFGVFQRLHHQNEFDGTGIGLANVRRILHRHGGQIQAEAKVNGGALFRFTLPGAGDEDAPSQRFD